MADLSEISKRNEFVKAMFDMRATELGQCFAPPFPCPHPPIRAHSIQNARVLDLLAQDGHLIAPSIRLQASRPPDIDFKPIGRHKGATTFRGLCSVHDRELFAAIETKLIDVTNPEHLFLLAYRAAYFEVHATCAAAWTLQMAYQKRVEFGYDPKGEPSEAGMLAVERIAVAYDTFRYKEFLDAVAASRSFHELQHDVFVHEVTRPTVAACVLFSLDELWDGDVVHVCLNIFPLEKTRTAIVFSYINNDAALARAELTTVLHSKGTSQLYEVSRRVLNHSQNFVLAPDYVSAWPASKREVVLQYFRRTALYNDLAFEHQDLYLF